MTCPYEFKSFKISHYTPALHANTVLERRISRNTPYHTVHYESESHCCLRRSFARRARVNAYQRVTALGEPSKRGQQVPRTNTRRRHTRRTRQTRTFLHRLPPDTPYPQDTTDGYPRQPHNVGYERPYWTWDYR